MFGRVHGYTVIEVSRFVGFRSELFNVSTSSAVMHVAMNRNTVASRIMVGKSPD